MVNIMNNSETRTSNHDIGTCLESKPADNKWAQRTKLGDSEEKDCSMITVTKVLCQHGTYACKIPEYIPAYIPKKSPRMLKTPINVTSGTLLVRARTLYMHLQPNYRLER